MLERVSAALKSDAADKLVARVAYQILGEIVKLTPKRWFGQVRRDWKVERLKHATYSVQNPNKIMRWLEDGTGHASGGYIYPKTAKALFVALTRRAAMSQRQTSTAVGFMSGVTNKTRRVARGGAGLVYGKDYVLAKRVRGISPRRIVAGMRPKAKRMMLDAMKAFLRQTVKGG